MKKRKIDFKIVLRNIIILLLFILFINYTNFINNTTNKLIDLHSSFVAYAQKNDIALTQENYASYIKKLN